MVGAAGVSLVATLGISQWLRVSRPARVAPMALLFSAILVAAIGSLVSAAPTAAAVLLYLLVTGIGPVMASSFWSVVNERFDPYQAKRVVARMAAAGALGGIAGGVLAERVAAVAGIPTLLFVLAGLCCACAFSVTRIGSGPEAAVEDARDRGPNDSGLALLRRIALLRQMAVLMLLLAVVETLVEYALKAEAARAFQTDASLVRFFAVFYTSCGLVAFVIQSVTGDRFLRRFGLAGAVAMLPLSVGITGLLGTVVAKLWTVTLVRGAETVASTAFFRAGFQLLYTPMATGVKRPAKVWVDVAAGSAGEVLGAGLVLLVLLAVPDLPTQVVMVGVVIGSILALTVVRRVHSGYVSELADSLQRGHVEIRAEDALDATTLHTIVHSQMSLSRTSLLERVRAFDAEQPDGSPSGDSRSIAAPSAAAPGQDGLPATAQVRGRSEDPTLEWIETLSSGDPGAIRAALAGGIDGSVGATPERRQRLVAWVVPLLGDDRFAREARGFLRPIAPRSVGQLADALLDGDQPTRVRARVAWILGEVDDARAVDGLWRASSDAAFPLRVSCARALARIAARAPALKPSQSEVHAAVERELDVDEQTWMRQRGRRDDVLGEQSVLVSRKALESVHDSLEHLFTLLALSYERELVASALAGLASGDEALRGTALELLESVLPAALRRKLWPQLHAQPPVRERPRSRQQIADELKKTVVGQVIDREALGRSS